MLYVSAGHWQIDSLTFITSVKRGVRSDYFKGACIVAMVQPYAAEYIPTLQLSILQM